MADAGSPHLSFRLLTYNINDEAISESAPEGWSLATQQHRLCDLIRGLHPDLLCLQECFTFPHRLAGEYDIHGEALSHRGSCVVGTRRGGPLKAAGPAVSVGPCVLVPLLLEPAGLRLFAASAHLAPFHEFGSVRAKQLAAIVAAAPPGEPLVVAGDLNMREKESGLPPSLGLADAWVEAGSPPAERWSWDTRVNRYYTQGHAYTARYDRVLYRAGCLRVRGFGLAANQPCSSAGGESHFLSDHFAVTARLELLPPPPPPPPPPAAAAETGLAAGRVGG
ncbi:hypothetical protein PLESTB_001476900 [Pleodorina starrii]|uniref:Endonuclease/exonuclease/phosphatase domain-containing protein n=1 Tax=Pleodorina starrii TaxID=330485 RepID=A0A9W6BW54_9CHLO|nr:hypothetical protein PLESTM_000648400 [Pleodorina starrii]GLC59349.1 hypothetical protein PLESTB_001476900 [Pleodorina starrii]GLC74452.1 hypothetical protein PLESTF_001514400 [Pleodorina starrii]